MRRRSSPPLAPRSTLPLKHSPMSHVRAHLHKLIATYKIRYGEGTGREGGREEEDAREREGEEIPSDQSHRKS